MAKLNLEKTRKYLQDFDFAELFIEELNWSNPANKAIQHDKHKDLSFTRKPIAELSGAVVYEISMPDGKIPNAKSRDGIANVVQKIKQENLLIFVDAQRSQSVWHWIKIQDKNGAANRKIYRSHFFMKGQTGDSFIPKLSGLFTDLSEFDSDGQISIAKVADKFKQALDIERITKKFFKEYETLFLEFVKLIKGINHEEDCHWYASVILNRLMFIYFLQKKGFIDNANYNYLSEKLAPKPPNGALLAPPSGAGGASTFYGIFLQKLFFEGFAKPEDKRDAETKRLIGKIKYLNGGLFLKHKIELKYAQISIPDVAFENLFRLFDNYSWSLNDTIGENDNEINPDVLGYIFEKYINQKEFGAYYTRPEITEYLCEQTVNKLILDQLNGEPLPDLSAFPALSKKLNSSAGQTTFESLSDLYTKLDAPTIHRLIDEKNGILPNLSLLDPACGSGAFLVAAMKTLINVYAAIIGRIEFINDKKLSDWLKKTRLEHPSLQYYIKKQIITNNLYGVDIMEEATEIAKLRLFLALVASAQTVDDLEPLPNIDFNIMAGNSLMGLMRVDSSRFDLSKSKETQLGLFAENKAKSYQHLINEKEAAIASYRNAHALGITDLQNLRESIQQQRREAYNILNQLLLEEFITLKIQYEEITWDAAKNKEGKAKKRPLTIKDIEALEPFHWGYEFSEIFTKKNGFDAIIANPPWETFQPNAKEFLSKFSENITKNKMDIKDFEDELKVLMKNQVVKEKWLDYTSSFSHTREYFRFSSTFANQVPIINGKRHGKDVNLYKLFVEQSFNLLKKNGYCGIVIPSGIYSDLGTKKLRELLFENSNITGLFSFENRKTIFENVDSRFKFVVLSFEKGKKTIGFPAAFMRHSVDELQIFPKYGANTISIDFIKLQNPDSLSIMEIKNPQDFHIAEKMLKFPTLADENSIWNLVLHREFNMTDDAHLFNKEHSNNVLPLYEGKMMHQFTNQWQGAETRFWVDIERGREALLGRKEDKAQVLGYQKYRIAHRAIARNTDVRTMISTIIPPCFTGNSLNISENLRYEEQLYCTSFLNSMILDWYLRQQVSANINMFYIYQLPVPRLQASDRFYEEIVERAAKLICTTEDFRALWEDVMQSPWTPTSGTTDALARNVLRSELDAMVAIIYGITMEELTYILSTFPIVSEDQKALVIKEFERITVEQEAIKSVNQQVKKLIEDWENSQVECKSTLRVDLRTNKPEKFIEHSVLKTIAAFLNSEGGTLLIGIEDSKNILGLQPDYDSFTKPDKLDEFQKHFDNLIGKSLGNRFQRNLTVTFPTMESKTICMVEVKEKSSEPVYVMDENNKETFYIRRLASTIDLKLSEATKYIQEHWKG